MEKRVISLILMHATTNAGVHVTYVTNLVFKEREPKHFKSSNTDGQP